MSARGLRRDRERTRNREARRRRRLALGAGAAMGAAAFAAPAADATNYTVTNKLDDGSATTLREAVVAANNNAGPDDILFDSSVTGQITLTSGELVITDEVNIHGPGANALTVYGNYNDRVFHIDIGGGPRETRGNVVPSVTISRLSIAEGYLFAPEFEVAQGAGIFNENADLTVESSRIHNNVIATYDAPGAQGAGIYSRGSLTLSNSEVSQNANLKYEGGGRGDRGVSPALPAGLGGGVYLYESSTISNSTISGNAATFGGGALANNEATTIDIKNSTIAENYANYAGGGIFRKYDMSSPGSTNLISTIVGDNFAVEFGDDLAETGSSATNRFTAAFSLISDTSGATVAETGPNVLDQDPLLGALNPNGGPTDTHLPATNSPAIDQGIANGLSTDQRGAGFARTGDNTSIANAAGGDGTDIGSVELQVAPGPETRPPPLTARECLGETATIVGTTGKDVITGTDGRDVIRGLRGNDVIKSVGGNDLVCGDKGVDKIRSGDGDDTVRGGNSGDRIRGGDGDDSLRGGSGLDKIFGEDGDDQLFGGAPRGKPAGGAGNGPDNVCDGGPGTDSAEGCETIRDVP